MAEKENETEEKNVDKVTGKEYAKSKQPLMSKKGMILVAVVLVVEAILVVLLIGGGGAKATDEENADSKAPKGVKFDHLYAIGKAVATVPYANQSRMVTVGSVSLAIDEKKAPGLREILEDKAQSQNFIDRALVVIEDVLRSYDYETFQQKGFKRKLEASLPSRIEKELKLEKGSIKTVILRDFRLPK